MGDGLAIGFTVSHWYAQLVMSFVDFAIRCRFKDVWFTRFMDNYVFTCGRKRTLHNVVNMIKERLASFALTIKQDWQVFPIKKRMIEFLSYRFNHDKVILRKALMIRMSRFYKHMTMSAHSARTVMSYQGITKHCNSYRFRKERIYPFVSISECRRLISNAGKKRTLLGTS